MVDIFQYLQLLRISLLFSSHHQGYRNVIHLSSAYFVSAWSLYLVNYCIRTLAEFILKTYIV
jgi:hypothetical protein